MCVVDAVQWIGCFLRLLCCGSVGGCVMCERWLARWRVFGVWAVSGMPRIGCFAWLLCCGSVGGCAMCERWLAHSGRCGVDGALGGVLDGYV